jgi:YD repeat-containing protein
VFKEITKTKDNKTTNFTYDNENNLISTIFPINRTETNSYNALNQLSTKTQRNGTVETYEHDENNNLVQTSFNETPTYQFTYNDHNEIISKTGPNSTITYERDKIGRITAESNNGATIFIL